jgi:hypothetical protein
MQNAEKATTFHYIPNSEVDDKSIMSVRAVMVQVLEERQTSGWRESRCVKRGGRWRERAEAEDRKLK